MPGGDGTGPMGMGPMTGGGRGYCVAPVSGIRTRPFGRRLFGRGCGRGWRNQFYSTGLPNWVRGIDDPEMLKEEAAFLKEELSAVQERLGMLEKSQGPKE